MCTNISNHTFKYIRPIIFQQSYLDTNLPPIILITRKISTPTSIAKPIPHLSRKMNKSCCSSFDTLLAFQSIRTTRTQRHLFAIRNRIRDIIELNTYIYIYTYKTGGEILIDGWFVYDDKISRIEHPRESAWGAASTCNEVVEARVNRKRDPPLEHENANV